MNALEKAIVEHFDKKGVVRVHIKKDKLENILSYLFHHSSTVEFSGNYTTFRR